MSFAARAVAAIVVATVPGVADAGECHVVDVQLQPASRSGVTPPKNQPPQIAVWVEDAAGNYLQTLFLTRQTGAFGLGNRPGRFDFNSGPHWPYGRRTTVLPVWAEKKPERFDSIVFQDGRENNLSHSLSQSSRETHFCRPMQPTEPQYDAMTCASPKVDSDKGLRAGEPQSKYPPRQDTIRTPGIDHVSVDTFNEMNPFDAISAATPAYGALSMISTSDLGIGDYVMRVEVSKEFDHNATFSPEAYPGPAVSFSEYGEPYRGQPSVLYQVPFSITDATLSATTATYAGYGDPDGNDGVVRPPDATITVGVPGSGAERLALVTLDHETFRVRVASRPEIDFILPAAPIAPGVTEVTSRSVVVTFTAPGDDGLVGPVKGYEVRYRVGESVTVENWDDARTLVVPATILPVEPNGLQTLELTGLLPLTDYSIGIRAYDDCHNTSSIATVDFTTADRTVGEVDACFIATAVYGSVFAADVQMLRGVRDSLLRKTVLGELAVEAYYTFSPPVAQVIGESEVLRATARELLVPIVSFVRAFRW